MYYSKIKLYIKGVLMKYDLLKKEFGYFGSFMIWDDTYDANGLPREISNKNYRDKKLNKIIFT